MKKAMIWGMYGGIGSALVVALKEEWLTFGAARQIKKSDQREKMVQADFTNQQQVNEEMRRLSPLMNPIDLWIYAGGDIVSSRIDSMDFADWSRIIDSNLTAAMVTYKASLPYLAEDAHLFFLGALSERIRLPGLSAYAAAKSALEAFVATIAKEDRKRKYTVVRPGAVATSFWNKTPFSLPSHSAQPDQVARKILEAYRLNMKGNLDLI